MTPSNRSEIMAMEMNLTRALNEDFYEGVFASIGLNWSMVGIYLLGLLSSTGVGLVSWFERSGQAGPYRTLLNQLMGLCLEQIGLMYTFGCGTQALRGIVGPLNKGFCDSIAYLMTFGAANVTFLILARAMYKLAFLLYFKAMPIMDDMFLASSTFLISTTLSIFLSAGKYYLKPVQLQHQSICPGLDPEDFETEGIDFPILGSIMVITFVVHTISSLVGWYKGQALTSPNHVPFNHQGASITEIGSNCANWLLIALFMAPIMVVGHFIREMDPNSLNQFPYGLLVQGLYVIIPTLGMIILFGWYLVTKEYFRRSVKGIFIKETIQVQPIQA